MSDKGEPTGVDPKATDAEAADGKINSAAEIEAIKESAGWKFPKVKLAAWDPEDETQWEAVSQGIAKRNLLSSIPNLTCGFGVGSSGPVSSSLFMQFYYSYWITFYPHVTQFHKGAHRISFPPLTFPC